MAELNLTDVLPGATQDADSITIPKAALHPSLGSDPDHKAEPIIAAFVWALLESGSFPDSGLEVASDQSISFVPSENQILRDFDTEQDYLYREVRVRLREPYNPTNFDAGVYG